MRDEVDDWPGKKKATVRLSPENEEDKNPRRLLDRAVSDKLQSVRSWLAYTHPRHLELCGPLVYRAQIRSSLSYPLVKAFSFSSNEPMPTSMLADSQMPEKAHDKRFKTNEQCIVSQNRSQIKYFYHNVPHQHRHPSAPHSGRVDLILH